MLLLGSAFPLSLIRRRAVIEPADLDEVWVLSPDFVPGFRDFGVSGTRTCPE